MLASFARGTYIFVVAMLFVAWALSLAKNEPAQAKPQPDQPMTRMYS
jgi:hypothetical protein